MPQSSALGNAKRKSKIAHGANSCIIHGKTENSIYRKEAVSYLYHSSSRKRVMELGALTTM
jgi:hypothetical protein